MQVSCPYCGRIHQKGFDCGKRPKFKQKGTEAQKFRHGRRWTEKSLQIRERDKFMCVYCYRHDGKITTDDVEVHHIVPIEEDYNRRLDDDNLVSLCRFHHEQAEANEIKRNDLLLLVKTIEKEMEKDLICT